MRIRIKYILLGLLILTLICFALVNTCNRQPIRPIISIETQPIKERADKLINKIKSDALVIDSLLKVKAKVITKYKTKTDSIYIASPDTCKPYILQARNECLKVDSANNNAIKAQGETIKNYLTAVIDLNSIIKIQNQQLGDSSKVITQLKKDVKKERRNGKIKAILSTISAALSGFGLGSLN